VKAAQVARWKAFDQRLSSFESRAQKAFAAGFETQRQDILRAVAQQFGG
jgi:hypothetical protein